MSEANVQTRSAEQLSCLLIQLSTQNLLLPNVSIAEVIQFIQPVPLQETPDWILGAVEWRGVKVPLIHYEAIVDELTEPPKLSRHSRIAIFNNVSGQASLPFFAMLVQGIPKLLKVKTEDVKIDEQNIELSRVEEMAVATPLGRATIPDLEYLETLIIRAL
ncbi:chemotaxis protein CheW [Marinicellulosiphila megalodicopiae]|uniref:chemotaxis protein CheW n=1 Tax=Marinicellulosiphila megalodicopiae TaxID=2724896 RepID=UPI003BB171DC